MDYNYIIRELAANREVFRALLTGKEKEEYLWKQKPEKWCLLEIVCHLMDEEQEDFRARILHVFENRQLPMPAINPTGWVLERKYMEQNYEEMVTNFLDEREKSVNWLESLINAAWENAYHHPKFGEMSGKLFLANWLAHDYLHIRQIVKLKYDYLKQLSGETLGYAGEW